ncbi:MAG: bifunctional hydroxymethylpyrimidine kinase/phosphomethylpyrimidine kinase [Proteobacteria bacterium]|nr:bifunctional hydroxymethylpyrimidine kinase/phosphomethylpyrimidine kinase [Pseudomonadota bacterium]
MSTITFSSQDGPTLTVSDDDRVLPAVCVLAFNANDASGAGGLAADVAAVASVGGHPLPVVTGAYIRDSAEIHDHCAFDDDAVADQARAVLEDMPVQAIKVGFVGSPENLGVIAAIASDYPEIPVVAYMPDLSWWHDDLIDQYQDAFQELLLPQASVLVGNHKTLWRWLLPDWASERAPTARDLAMAVADSVPYLLVTGIPANDQHLENTLTSAQTVLGSGRFERFEATFVGAGDTLSATLAALVASGNDLGEATSEALTYLDGCLEHGFRPGMGHVLPDRMFWAEPDEDDNDDESAPVVPDFDLPPHDTQH